MQAAREPARYRQYGAGAPPRVAALYRENHARQNLAFVQAKREEYLPPRRLRMGVWEAMEALASIEDESDPDTADTQLDHALQTAEALRRDGAPAWLVLAGLVHDLGKVLCLFGEPQWAVVGDTFPVGCRFDGRIVHAELFEANPDHHDPRYATSTGIYRAGCGLDAMTLSWGHDEYLYHVLAPHLPAPVLDIVRYHSFYAWHREGAYRHLMDRRDEGRLRRVRRFQPYDLYSKGADPPDWPSLRRFYERLVADFLPAVLDW